MFKFTDIHDLIYLNRVKKKNKKNIANFPSLAVLYFFPVLRMGVGVQKRDLGNGLNIIFSDVYENIA